MIGIVKDLVTYRELVAMLAWRNILVRYKQAFFGIAWALFRPLLLMLIFTIVRTFVGIDSGDIPYPILTFAALLPWILFQDAASEAIGSVTSNAALIRKVYFPREIFPITALITKLLELAISFVILAGLMIYYQMMPTVHALWVPLIVIYTLLVALVLGLAGAALNVFYRDVSAALPVLTSLLMYLSPVIYPLSLVEKTLLEEQVAGRWSEALFTIYTLNPLVGIIDGFQRAMLKGLPPDFMLILPGLVVTILLLPLSYSLFKRAEAYFADII